MSGQVPNQGRLPQQNGNPLQPAQMQNLGIAGGVGAVGVGGPPHNTLNMDPPDLIRTREYMQGKIIEVLKLRHQLPITEASMIRFRDFVRRLEEGLFKIAHTKEDYINLSTLEHRLQTLVKGSRNVHNQRHLQLVNSESAPVGTMIPTPGNISNGYQQSPANFPIASGGMSSIGLPRMTSQMVPTPGFNSNNNNSSINNRSSNIVGGLSTVESTMVSQPQQQLCSDNSEHLARKLDRLAIQRGVDPSEIEPMPIYQPPNQWFRPDERQDMEEDD